MTPSPANNAQPIETKALPCAAVVLAAGASTRLGVPKQLLRVNGETLLRRSVRAALEAGCSPVAVVLGPQAGIMFSDLNGLDAIPVVNANWRSGMASSLRAGLIELARHEPEPPNVLVLVCDQPAVTSEVIRSLLATHAQQGKLITASAYANTRGVPAVFSAAVLPELLELTGDEGARAVIGRVPARVADFDFADGATDVDTPEDARMLLKQENVKQA
ncbi:MAG: nucleotidyltransferase family protein [Acidobacteriaceae bacterium]